MTRLFVDRRELITGAMALGGANLAGRALAAPPAQLPLNFLVVGDWGRDGREHQVAVADAMAAEAEKLAAGGNAARFIASTGDNFYNLGVSSKHDRQWTTSFENIYRHDALKETVWHPVLGNHDYGGSARAQVDRTGIDKRWDMPDRWYVIRGANFGRRDIDLFFIDTPVWTGKEKFPYAWFGSRIDRADQIAQALWLTDALLSSTATFKLVFGHYPIYSVGAHGGAARMLELDRLLRRTGVTAYVCGHDHCLYHIRTDKMDYLCSGAGSEELAKFTGAQPVPGCVLTVGCPVNPDPARNARSVFFAPWAGFASFSVLDDRIDVSFINRVGGVMRQVSLPPRAPDPSVRLDREAY